MIRRYNDFLNESLIQDDLINKLLSIGGNNVILGRDTEEEIRRMIDDGRLFDEDMVSNNPLTSVSYFFIPS